MFRHFKNGGFGSQFFLSGIILLLALFIQPAVFAGATDVGTILVDDYRVQTGGGLGGVNFIIHFTNNGEFAAQDCCQAGDLRWLQRVTSSAATGFTPTPNRPFIDHRTGQAGGDASPFKDCSYGNLDDAINNANRNLGPGPYLGDAPQVFLTRGPYTFTAETLLVCVEADMMLGILGGIRWGFTIGADMTTVTPLAPTPLSDTMALRDAFNTALGLDFPGWTIKPATTLWPDAQPTFTLQSRPMLAADGTVTWENTTATGHTITDKVPPNGGILKFYWTRGEYTPGQPPTKHPHYGAYCETNNTAAEKTRVFRQPRDDTITDWYQEVKTGAGSSTVYGGNLQRRSPWAFYPLSQLPPVNWRIPDLAPNNASPSATIYTAVNLDEYLRNNPNGFLDGAWSPGETLDSLGITIVDGQAAGLQGIYWATTEFTVDPLSPTGWVPVGGAAAWLNTTAALASPGSGISIIAEHDGALEPQLSITLIDPTVLAISFVATPGLYVIEHKTFLSDPEWRPLQALTSTGGVVQAYVSPGSAPSGFYRAQQFALDLGSLCTSGLADENILSLITRDMIYCVSDFGWSDTWLVGTNLTEYDEERDVLSGDDAANLRYSINGQVRSADGWLTPGLDAGELSPSLETLSPYQVIPGHEVNYVNGDITKARSRIAHTNDGIEITITTELFGLAVRQTYEIANTGTNLLQNLRLADYFNFHPNGSADGSDKGSVRYVNGRLITTGLRSEPDWLADGEIVGERLDDAHHVDLPMDTIAAIQSNLYNNGVQYPPAGTDDAAGALAWNLGNLPPGGRTAFVITKRLIATSP